MEILKGTATFSGIAVGRVLYYNRGEFQIRQGLVGNIRNEIKEFNKARKEVIEELHELYQTNAKANEEWAASFENQATLLESKAFCSAIESSITYEKVSAAYAVLINRDELSATFHDLENPAVHKRISDISEISNRLIYKLGGASRRINLGQDPVILVTESLSPAEIMEMDRAKLLGVVMHHGAAFSHTSIVARTMEIPTLVGIPCDDEWEGSTAIVDGYTGTMYIDPDEEIRKEYRLRLDADRKAREDLLKFKEESDVTLDGHEIRLYANIGNLSDIDSALYYGASGIGLLRSEFQYLGKEDYPGEEELFEGYKKLAQTMGERPAVIRTADLGADKQAPYMEIPSETNPIMGNRGIRFCLDHKDVFATQLRAIYRASVFGNLAIMFPMIDSEEEMDEVEAILSEVKKGLKDRKIAFKDVQLGIMIETPAAVMISRELAKRVDFLSLGTNDLTQYTLAMDRQNSLLKNKYNDHHPALLRMIQIVVDSAHAEGRKVGICGEIAADTKLTGTFLKMGIDFLSVVPACILPVRKEIRNTKIGE